MLESKCTARAVMARWAKWTRWARWTMQALPVGGEKDDGVKGDEMEEARTGPHPCSVESRR